MFGFFFFCTDDIEESEAIEYFIITFYAIKVPCYLCTCFKIAKHFITARINVDFLIYLQC